MMTDRKTAETQRPSMISNQPMPTSYSGSQLTPLQKQQLQQLQQQRAGLSTSLASSGVMRTANQPLSSTSSVTTQYATPGLKLQPQRPSPVSQSSVRAQPPSQAQMQYLLSQKQRQPASTSATPLASMTQAQAQAQKQLVAQMAQKSQGKAPQVLGQPYGPPKTPSNAAALGALNSVQNMLQTFTAKQHKAATELSLLRTKPKSAARDHRMTQLASEYQSCAQQITACQKQYEQLRSRLQTSATPPSLSSPRVQQRPNPIVTQPPSSIQRPHHASTPSFSHGSSVQARRTPVAVSSHSQGLVADALKIAKLMHAKYVKGIEKPQLSHEKIQEQSLKRKAQDDRLFVEMKTRCKKAKEDDHANVNSVSQPLVSLGDTIKRLMSFHVFEKSFYGEEDNEADDEAYHKVCETLVERSDVWIKKFRTVLYDNSKRTVPSAEAVMLDRALLQHEKDQIQKLQSQMSTIMREKSQQFQQQQRELIQRKQQEDRERRALVAELAATGGNFMSMQADPSSLVPQPHLSLEDLSSICGLENL